MCSQYIEKYGDFIDAYDKLFHLKADETIEVVFDLITEIIVSKYKTAFKDLILSILTAIQYNYGSVALYIKILNQILAKYAFSYKNLLQDRYISGISQRLRLNISINSDISSQVDFNRGSFPKENEIQYIIMHDQIDKFREYISENSLEGVSISLPIFFKFFSTIDPFSPIEACCYF
ncbi:hypothetical protein TVAG_127550 [Trichomonas vaginalis G3]|uniref:Uncharacterized protein n=1 Tax=Trichomonas vaginalis (strain ATCC PRA-98 / G3) TaxID=412133 RepID=A2E822_TRIV3|nr:hypothetical protein TVAG_127550 [Trichomonas vaginalis G3]|eukprot:XP_001323471.1 hypothetical protein [Trichomonas vaginalis G3]